MTIDDKIKDEKLQYNINREEAKILPLSSVNIHKYEYLKGEEILPSDQSRTIEQAKFTYSPLGKTFEKQMKTIEEQGKKQVEALQVLKLKENKKSTKSIDGLFPKGMRTNEIKNETNGIKKWESEFNRKDLQYERKICVNDFQQYHTIRYFLLILL